MGLAVPSDLEPLVTISRVVRTDVRNVDDHGRVGQGCDEAKLSVQLPAWVRR